MKIGLRHKEKSYISSRFVEIGVTKMIIPKSMERWVAPWDGWMKHEVQSKLELVRNLTEQLRFGTVRNTVMNIKYFNKEIDQLVRQYELD